MKVINDMVAAASVRLTRHNESLLTDNENQLPTRHISRLLKYLGPPYATFTFFFLTLTPQTP